MTTTDPNQLPLFSAEPASPPAANSRAASTPRTSPASPHPAPPSHPDDGARRVLIVGAVMIVAVTALLLSLVARVVQLQTRPPQGIAALVDSQRSIAPLAARRGNVVDAQGRLLAATRVAYTLFVDPQLIEDPGTFSEQVGYNLGYDPAWIEQTIFRRRHSRFIVLDPRLSEERLALLDGFRLRGLAIQPRLVRDYPQGPLAAHVIGFVGTEGKGLEGLERQLDEQLRGDDGRIAYLRDAQRRPLWVERSSFEPHTDGQPVQLSLDATIQALAERHLSATCEKYGAQSGQIVIMRPRTGEILAMVNYPGYDPNALAGTPAERLKNRSVTDVFEPGSTFKVFTWAAMTDAGMVRPDEKLDCTTAGVWRSSRGRRLRDASPHGMLTWDQVLIRSSNIGMAIGGERMGAAKLHEAVRRFGFGSISGSQLPGEVAGIVNPLRQWNHYSVTSVPMGQEVGVTALQLVRAFAAIANDGLLLPPTIHPRKADTAPPALRVLSPAAAAHTKRILRQVVTEGTGRKANSRLYTIFGKTGTAQVPDTQRGGYIPGAYVGSFIAGAPLDDPQIVIGCFIHRPERERGYYGGTIAAPTAMKVIEETLAYLGIPPSTDDTAPPAIAQR